MEFQDIPVLTFPVVCPGKCVDQSIIVYHVMHTSPILRSQPGSASSSAEPVYTGMHVYFLYGIIQLMLRPHPLYLA
jgi:hypothetical protein